MAYWLRALNADEKLAVRVMMSDLGLRPLTILRGCLRYVWRQYKERSIACWREELRK